MSLAPRHPFPAHAPAPTPRAGRHVRATTRRIVLAGASVVALALVLLALAGAAAAALALSAGIVGSLLAVVRLLTAHDADLAEDRWLRQVLGTIRAPEDEPDDDGGLLVC